MQASTPIRPFGDSQLSLPEVETESPIESGSFPESEKDLHFVIEDTIAQIPGDR